MARQYNTGGSTSSIGAEQYRDFYWQRKALTEARKEQYFMQLGDTTNLPKHMGKTIKRYHYLPLLDDANINDQGIDANGLSTSQKVTIVVTRDDGTIPDTPFNSGVQNNTQAAYIVGEGTTPTAAEADAVAKLVAWAGASTNSGGQGKSFAAGVSTDAARFAELVVAGPMTELTSSANDGDSSLHDDGFRFNWSDGTVATAVKTTAAVSVPQTGNLYGSSKDVGTVQGKLPALGETGGKVNRVGFKRREIEGSIQKMGFYDDYTKESVDFDSDDAILEHVNREMLNGAVEMSEDALQIDLLNGAGVVRYGGDAVSTATLTGNLLSTPSIPTYQDFMKLNIDLDNNRCPKDTEIITGTRNVDTKTLNSARIMYIGSELITMVKSVKGIDNVAGSGFVSVEKYASAGNVLRGEIGQIDQMKIVVVPEMMHWAGAGADVGSSTTANAGYRSSLAETSATDPSTPAATERYDVFPMLVVGSKSFQTIGFQSSGKNQKFKIKHVRPESDGAYNGEIDPYGEKGFMSIKWYYGTMILRPEWIALYKVVAPW